MTQNNEADLLAEQAAKFAAQHERLGLLGRGTADAAQLNTWMLELARAGWTGLRLAESANGSELSTYELCCVAEAFGRKLMPTYVPLATAVSLLDTAAAAPAALRDEVLEGRALILPALQSEGLRPSPGHGSKAEADGAGGFVLTGSKHMVPDAASAAGFIADARGPSGLMLFFIPRDAKGLTIETETCVDGSQAGTLRFDRLMLPADCVLAAGPDADALLDRLRHPLQIALAAEIVGAATELFERTLAFLRTRRQFGRSLGAFQALQHRAVDIFCDIELSRALTMEAARVTDLGKPGTLELIAGARARAGLMAQRLGKWAVQMHGAMGFTDECDVGLFLKRLMVLTRLYRTPQAHRRRFADSSWAKDAPNLFELFRSETDTEASFRAEVRAFLDAELPAHLCDLPTRPKVQDAIWWHRKLNERGWIAPAWPKEHGGMDASVEQRLVLFEELALKGAPELSSQAIYHIGPIIIRFGTPEQKAKHLPPMLTAERLWCQGYSEPNSGSDLASLRTSARVDGDKLVINGQKIWTTGAQHAQWMFALVRTDPDAADRRNGISMVLIDMASKGITVRPIRTIAGEDEFAEVFFDNVEVPLENVMSGLNEGWKLANTVLETERLTSGSPQKVILLLDRVRRVALETGASEDAAFRERLADAEIDVLAFQAAFARVLDRVKAGQTPGTASSILKLVNGELAQTLADLMFEASGSAGELLAPMNIGDRKVPVGLSYLQARRQTIYGGTSEIQRNILARRVLDLGNEPKRGT
jgi:alkylation response protein AidB-like acyl-CoA dehydrogenase